MAFKRPWVRAPLSPSIKKPAYIQEILCIYRLFYCAQSLSYVIGHAPMICHEPTIWFATTPFFNMKQATDRPSAYPISKHIRKDRSTIMNTTQQPTPRLAFVHQLSDNKPQALAWVRGGNTNPNIIGRSVILHANRDAFTSQPSGDPGAVIACGVIFSE